MIVLSLRLYRYGVPYGFNDAKIPKFFAVGGSQLSLWSLVNRQSSFIHSSEKHTRSSLLNRSFRYPESYLIIKRIGSFGCLRLNGITSSISNTIVSTVNSFRDGSLVTVIYTKKVWSRFVHLKRGSDKTRIQVNRNNPHTCIVECGEHANEYR